MKRFFSSDFHFFHDRVVKYSNRPWSALEQTEKLVEIWNNQVKDCDEVYHLGDFAFIRNKKGIDKLKNLLHRLNGKKHFILGNHCDREVWSLIDQDLTLNVSVKEYDKIKIDNHKVILFHYALRTWDSSRYGSFNLYGHSHGELPPIGKQLDVGIDNSIKVLGEYKLFEWKDILKFMKERENSL